MYWLNIFFCIFASFSCCLEARTTVDVLRQINLRARESGSDAVLITRNGVPIFEYAPHCEWLPLETMSITKSFVSLAVGMLIDDGLIESIDTPIYEFYPELNQGCKKEITIRHLLSHTSGIQPECSTEEIYSSCDILQLALVSELSAKPGSCYYPNNKAFNLLSGIIKIASGMDVNEYLTKRLLGPIGADGVAWASDPSGTPYAIAHMIATAPTLAKVGWVLANNGCWCGRQLISKCWIQTMTQPHQCADPFMGLQWAISYYNIECCWDDNLLYTYRQCGICPQFVNTLATLGGRTICCDGCRFSKKNGGFYGWELERLFGRCGYCEEFYRECRQYGLPIACWSLGCKKSFSARGYLGQQLIVLPESKIVGVRQIRNIGQREECADNFDDFECLLDDLARAYQ